MEIDGVDHVDGVDGEDGVDGVDGNDKDDGVDGVDGVDGRRRKSSGHCVGAVKAGLTASSIWPACAFV